VEAINALLGALQRAGFSTAADTGGDAATTTDKDGGSPLSQLIGKLAKALGTLEKDEKKGTPPSKDDLKQLQAAVTALSGYLATLQAGAAATPAGSATAPPADGGSTAAISAATSFLGAATGSAGDATPGDAPADGGTADGAATGSGNIPLGQLADKVEALSSALARSQPGLAGDLDKLARVLEPGMRGTAPVEARPAGATAASTAVSAPPNPATGKDATPSSSVVNTPMAPNATTPSANGAQIKSAHASKPDSDKPDEHGGGVAGKPASTDKAPRADKADMTAASPTADPADAQPNGTPSATNTAQGAPSAAAAVAPPQAPASAGTALTQQAQAAYQPVDTAAVNLPQMAFEIARHVDHGSSQFQIRLDPADLGRVDVKLAVDPTGAISAHLSAERPETLDLLRRDAGALNQALTQAGLDGSKTNLQFSLSQNPFTRQDSNPQPTPQTGGTGDASPTAPIPVAPAISLYRGHMASSGLNIFV
jgi:flagellar hook-length control protein FliK